MVIPVYLFTGFLESGKTTLIQDTLCDPSFHDGEKTLLLVCEDGFIEYDEAKMRNANTSIVKIEEEDALTTSLLNYYQQIYKPNRIMIEFNGMWSVKRFFNMELPSEWLIVQILSTVDASTFTSYMNNMRSIFYEQLFASEVVIFNRCSNDMKKTYLRTNLKAINPRAQLIYETVDGQINTLKEEELPFDKKANKMVIADDDYGLWYMDALDHPDDYEGKTITVKGMVVKDAQCKANEFLIGRRAMVCCADDTQMIGVLCKSDKTLSLVPNEWVMVSGIAHSCFDEEYQGNLIEIEVSDIVSCDALKDEFVYFS